MAKGRDEQKSKVKGLTEDILRTDVELKLRLAGIKILSIEEQLKTLGMPWLYLNINTLTLPSGVLFSWTVFLHLRQEVDLRTKKTHVFMQQHGRHTTLGVQEKM